MLAWHKIRKFLKKEASDKRQQSRCEGKCHNCSDPLGGMNPPTTCRSVPVSAASCNFRHLRKHERLTFASVSSRTRRGCALCLLFSLETFSSSSGTSMHGFVWHLCFFSCSVFMKLFLCALKNLPKLSIRESNFLFSHDQLKDKVTSTWGSIHSGG